MTTKTETDAEVETETETEPEIETKTEIESIRGHLLRAPETQKNNELDWQNTISMHTKPSQREGHVLMTRFWCTKLRPKSSPKMRTIFWPQNVPTGRSDWLLVLPYCGRVFCTENGPCFLPAPCGGWHRDFLWLKSSLRIGPARFVPALTWNNFLIVNALTRGITSPAFLRLFKNIYFTASLILVSTMLSLLLFLHSSMLLLLSCFVFLSVFSFQVPHPFLAWHDLFPCWQISLRSLLCFALPCLALVWFDLVWVDLSRLALASLGSKQANSFRTAP